MSMIKTMLLPQITEEEQTQAKKTLEAILRSGKFRLEADGTTFAVPPSAAQQIVALLKLTAAGEPPGVVCAKIELPVKLAAEFLQIPEPYLIELLDSEVIPWRQSGSDRLITLAHLLKFEQETQEMQNGLDEIVQLSQEMGLYDD